MIIIYYLHDLISFAAVDCVLLSHYHQHLNTDSDSEVLLNVFAHELQVRGKLEPTSEDIFASVAEVHKRCSGAYAVVGLIANYGMFAFRDPNGIRPLCFGVRH